jgi:predicted nucleic acid-binding protein
MNVVDSSAWVEYLTDGPNASQFARAVQATDQLLVPALVVFEVFKKVLQECGEQTALEVAAQMMRCRVVDVTATLALEAARLSVLHRLPMADALILASARAHHAVLWTQDAHFEGLPRVEYRRARSR